MATADADTTIYVAIDFGTTKSGYAFALGKSKDIVAQPETGGAKMETMLLLKRADRSLHLFGKAAWEEFKGLEDDEKEKFYFFDRFKMALFSDEAVGGEMRIKARCSDESLPARIVFGRALQYFHEAARKRIAQAIGEHAWEEHVVMWIVTVPAIWGDRAKDFMVEAAKEAGLYTEDQKENFKIALEPEAGALSCREDLLHVWREQGRPDAICYMVIDCGGGTVDFTVHQLNISTMKVAELHRATGNDWGGTKVDQEVKNFISDLIGENASRDIDEEEWMALERDYIEPAKLMVSEQLDRVNMTFPGGFVGAVSAVKSFPSGVEFRRRQVLLTFKTIFFQKFFQRSLQEITDHARELLDKHPEVCCLVLLGGYAGYPFVFDRLYSDFHSAQLSVIRPSNASTAILKGAVMFGQYPDSIERRVMKNTYGLAVMRPFILGKHPRRKMITTDQGDRCKDVFEKIVEIGESVQLGQVFKRTFWSPSADTNIVFARLFRVRSPKKEVEFVDDPDCEQLCQVNIPLVGKGLDRRVRVEIDFSGTHLHFTGIDCESDKAVSVDVCY